MNGKRYSTSQRFDQVEVFSATKARERGELGERVTSFIRGFRGEVVDTCVLQSSDREFHCLTIVLFLRRTTDGRRQTQEGTRR